MPLADIVIRVGADLRQFTTAMQQMEAQMKRVGRQMEQTGSTLTKAITLPIAGLSIVALKAYADLDSLKRGLISIAGSAEGAEKEFTNLREVAKLPGIGLQEAVRGSINLQAIGVSADDARRAMMAFGNAIATVGGRKDNFDLAIRGFAQLRNAAKPMQQDLYQIANQLPQVNKLMVEAFGTNRAEDLAAMGITGKQLAEFLVSALEKLPPVTGGIANAFENAKDSLMIFGAGIGETINKVFNIEGLLNDLSNSLANVKAWFDGLSPSTQKFILVAAAVAAAIGPILLGLGLLASTVIPAVSAAFSLMMGPVGLVIAGIAAAAYLIITNWDTINAYFTSGEGKAWMDRLVTTFHALSDIILPLVQAFIENVLQAWNGFLKPMLSDAMSVMESISGFIGGQLDLINGLLKASGQAMAGNWKGAWQAIKDTTLSIGNSIWEWMVRFSKGFYTFLSDAAAFVGAKDLSSYFAKTADAIGGMTGSLNAADSAAEKLNGELARIAKVKDNLSWLTADKSGGGTTSTFIPGSKPADKGVSLKFGQANIGDNYLAKIRNEKEILAEWEAEAKAASLIDPFAAMRASIATTETPLKKFTQEQIEQQAIIQKNNDLFIRKMQAFSQSIGQTLAQGASNAIQGMSSIVAGLAMGTKGINDLPAMLLGTLGSLLEQLGKMCIAVGIGMLAIKTTLKFGNPYAALAAGAALLILGGVVAAESTNLSNQIGNGADSQQSQTRSTTGYGQVQHFASGGIAFGPTLGLMGEYPGAKTNPEVIAPLNKLKDMLPGGTDGMNGTVTFKIGYNELVGILDRGGYQKRRGT